MMAKLLFYLSMALNKWSSENRTNRAADIPMKGHSEGGVQENIIMWAPSQTMHMEGKNKG